MYKNYLTYPCKVMRITQSYTGTTSHKPHTIGNIKDYPIDEGCEDTGRSYMYCPCDEMVIKRIYGVKSRGTNTLWLESTDEVYFADGSKGFFTMLITHPDDSDLQKLKKGQKFRRKEIICREGKDGATAYHFHFSGGKGKFDGNGWTKNSKGKYVLTVTDKSEKPEKLFFIDPNFTKVKNSAGLSFSVLSENLKKGKYTVTAEKLNVRTGPSVAYDTVPYSKFKAEDKKKIKKLKGSAYKESYFVKGMTVKIKEIHGIWGKTASGWICLDYCRRLSQ